MIKRRRSTCYCDLCKTTRKFSRIVKSLPKQDRKWMLEYYDWSFEQGAELEMLEAYHDELRKEGKIP